MRRIVTATLLALTLGTPQGTPITLTDKLETILVDAGETGLSHMLAKARLKWGSTGPLILSNAVRPSPLDALTVITVASGCKWFCR